MRVLVSVVVWVWKCPRPHLSLDLEGKDHVVGEETVRNPEDKRGPLSRVTLETHSPDAGVTGGSRKLRKTHNSKEKVLLYKPGHTDKQPQNGGRHGILTHLECPLVHSRVGSYETRTVLSRTFQSGLVVERVSR